jgi:hypothetical protein
MRRPIGSTATTRGRSARAAEEWLAFFRDPDGHALALASRIVRRA